MVAAYVTRGPKTDACRPHNISQQLIKSMSAFLFQWLQHQAMVLKNMHTGVFRSHKLSFPQPAQNFHCSLASSASSLYRSVNIVSLQKIVQYTAGIEISSWKG